MTTGLLALIPEADREEVAWRVAGMLRCPTARRGQLEPLRSDAIPDA